MSARIVLIAALIGAVAAFPTAFLELRSYGTNAACTGGTAAPTTTAYFVQDVCIATSASTSVKYTVTGATLLTSTYTANQACTGTAANIGNVTLNTCSFAGTKWVQSTETNFYTSSSFSDTACATLVSGPSAQLAGCSSFGGSSVQVNIGKSLEFCVYSAGGCSGDSQCQSIGHGDCVSVSGQGSAQYDWNAASSATPAVALTAALVAAVLAITKF